MRTTDADGMIAASLARYKGDPRFAPGQVVDGRLICGAKKRDGDPCGKPPPNGATRCGNHGGKSPQAVRAAEKRTIEAGARAILGRIDPDAPQEHPVAVLVKLINLKWAEVLWLRAKVQELDDDALTWGRTEHRTGAGPEGPIDVETFKAEQNIWWKLLREAENQLASWTAAAAKAGVEERTIKLAEQQGELVFAAMNRIFRELDLTETQQARLPEVVPRILRSIAV